ncbi:snRNA-activating protein complex subunit 1-like [Electrophorus electricus]|uniref:snRNA-activating protein complex subunit 1-like n=1 Tax=Electrophorus electricus TaxID=8005 RepID=UPI0015D002D8|nr:snRNA-activating protein complex subunit 1b isoform X1 [Electrophorus electricus]XP_035387237.1 snRNA-activating protein complex subunit 1-like [Electrophorus electricus]
MEYFKRTLNTDCENILGRFQATASVRFEVFSAIWREINFSSIFYGPMEPNKCRVFTRLVLSVAAPYLLPPYAFQIRVGGLYLLYGLYSSQLTTPKEKVRLALKDWDELMRFQQDAVDAQHYDVVFILRKLLHERAFHFTAMPNPLYFKVKRRQVERQGQQLCETFIDRPSRAQELISTDMLEELANVHEHYENLKRVISAQTDQPILSLVKQNLVPKLRGAVLTYYNWQRNQTEFEDQHAESDRGAGEGTSNQDESSRRAQLLALIKSKSYGQAVEASKSRRHRQIEIASSDTKSEPAPNVLGLKKRSLKKESLRKRTSGSLHSMNQGNLNRELESTTRLWRLTMVDDEKIKVETNKRRFKWNQKDS